MKRKIAILLAAVMTAAMLPMNVLANSENSINKVDTVKDDEKLNNVVLKIIPKDEITSSDSIVLSVTNGEFLGQSDIDKSFQWSSAVSGYEDYYKSVDRYSEANTRNNGDKAANSRDTLTALGDGGVSSLPFRIVNAGKKTIDVKLYPIAQTYANENMPGSSAKGKPAYYITLPVKATDAGDVKIKIDSNNTGIYGQEITVATATSSSGGTITTIDDTNTGNDDVTLEAITMKESVKNTFKSGETVTLKVSNGFVFANNKTATKPIKVVPGSNLTFKADINDTLKITDDEITFTMPHFNELNSDGKRDKLGSIKIENIKILPDDDDNDWGDISITVKGAGLTRETIKVGTRADYGFKMTALEDPKTVLAGRFSAGENDDNRNDAIYKRIDKDDCVAAEIKFEETIADTWMTDRKLEFKVPEGVKIYDVEFDEVEKISGGLDIDGDMVTISDDGSTIKIKGKEIDEDAKAKFKMKLYLSVDPNFQGDIALSVSGGGVAEGVVDDVIVANAVTPVTIESSSTKANMGYQKINTANITITEAQSGVLLKDGDVVVELDSVYGSKELGFADDGIDYEVNGDMEIKNFKVDDGAIKFKVDRESSKEPASITIKNVKIGTTRSIPYGSYNFKVNGSAVINNYDENSNASDYKVDNKGGKTPGYFDTKSYKFPNYLVIQTETGTLDKVVKVTIDEKTILMDDKSYDMDVAPYIQTSSNSTMVPLRFVTTALGVDADNIANPDESSKINWDPNSKTVTIYYGSGTNMTIIKFVAGSNKMTINGTEVPMDNGVVAEIKNDRMFVPFRALGTALGVKVSWNAETRTATYNDDIASASN